MEPEAAVDRCPKSMRFGPCGGVAADGTCEAMPERCAFLDPAVPAWDLPRAESGAGTGATGSGPPTLLVDLRPDLTDPRTLGRAAHRLRAAMPATTRNGSERTPVAVLVGDHLDDPDDASPARLAAAVVDAGLDAVVTVSGRRPHRAAVRQAVAAHRAGASGVLCVTGDHPAARGLEQRADFGTESIRVTTDASALGVPVVVAESPASPPAELRVRRVLAKQRAGASSCVLNHAGPVSELVGFARRARDVGVRLPLVAPVPVVTDGESARRLDRFPGLVLPPGFLAGVLGAPDPRSAGIDAAVELAVHLLDSGEFVGVNLSGVATGNGLVAHADIAAEIVERVLLR